MLNWGKLLDRGLDLLDTELFSHLRSKNLSAEIYAFPCKSLSAIPTTQKGLMFDSSRPDALCVHSAARSSAPTVGFPARLWSAPQRPLRHCTTTVDARRNNGFNKVIRKSTRGVTYAYSSACIALCDSYELSRLSTLRL